MLLMPRIKQEESLVYIILCELIKIFGIFQYGSFAHLVHQIKEKHCLHSIFCSKVKLRPLLRCILPQPYRIIRKLFTESVTNIIKSFFPQQGMRAPFWKLDKKSDTEQSDKISTELKILLVGNFIEKQVEAQVVVQKRRSHGHLEAIILKFALYLTGNSSLQQSRFYCRQIPFSRIQQRNVFEFLGKVAIDCFLLGQLDSHLGALALPIVKIRQFWAQESIFYPVFAPLRKVVSFEFFLDYFMDLMGGNGNDASIYLLRKDRPLLVDPKIDSFRDSRINFNSSNVIPFYKLPLIIDSFIAALSQNFFANSDPFFRIFDDGHKGDTIIAGLNRWKNGLSEIADDCLLNLLFELRRHEVSHRNYLPIANRTVKYNNTTVAVQQKTGLVLQLLLQLSNARNRPQMDQRRGVYRRITDIASCVEKGAAAQASDRQKSFLLYLSNKLTISVKIALFYLKLVLNSAENVPPSYVELFGVISLIKNRRGVNILIEGNLSAEKETIINAISLFSCIDIEDKMLQNQICGFLRDANLSSIALIFVCLLDKLYGCGQARKQQLIIFH